MPIDIPEIPVTSQNGCTIVNIPTPDGRSNGGALLINPGSGMGYNSLEVSQKYAMDISDSIDYEISFWLLQLNTEASLKFSVDTFNPDFLETPTFDVKTTLFNRDFLPPAPTTILPFANKFFFVRHVLYAYTQKSLIGQQPLTSLAAGTNLVMGRRTRNLFVTIKNIGTQNIFIWKFQVKPLRTPFSTGFIQSGNLIEIWRKNNNQTLSNEEVDRAAQQFLLPYNTGQSVINL